MLFAPELSHRYLNYLNEAQRSIVSHKEGPLLVIAGPGSGKTRSLTLLAMNLLLCGDARPSELVLCTFTEKAAYEMQDRIGHLASDVDYTGDLSQLRIGTIHGICNQLISEHLHHTPLGSNYETLDEFDQQLLIFEHLEDICTEEMWYFFRRRWGTLWLVAKKLRIFFDKIAEELIFDKLQATFPDLRFYSSESQTFLCYLTHAYKKYKELLVRRNCIDFAHSQVYAHDLLRNPYTFRRITNGIRYVLVDEYQDTNYIQEQILTLLSSGTPTRNLCVVGDEDQALYRFRGATVRNILEFDKRFPDCKKIYLITNYRSHKAIIDFYNRWIKYDGWPRPPETSFRTEKTIQPVSDRKYGEYPAVFTMLGVDVHAEAEQFAEFVLSLKAQGRIKDYSEVALLLHSVKGYMSDPYVEALKRRGIPSFCPRARTYFNQDEVGLMIACLARITGYQEARPNGIIGQDYFPSYLRSYKEQLAEQCKLFPSLEKELRLIEHEIFSTDEGWQGTGKQLADYFYRLIFTEPFIHFLREKDKRHNLMKFSQLLKVFQKHYHHTAITAETLKQIKLDFFQTFLCVLLADGMNQHEDPQSPFPTGYVQIMTIHQAKGLEFPVIAVGRLDKLPPQSDDEDGDLQAFYHRSRFEPASYIQEFDHRRLYYVAFSRARSMLALGATKKPDARFASLLRSVPGWPEAQSRLRSMPRTPDRGLHSLTKPRYSYTNHIQMYEICPRKFRFFQEYNFTPAYTVDAFSGLLVHQALERIHKLVLEGKLGTLDEMEVRIVFDRAFNFLQCSSMQTISWSERERALHQVLNYFHQNYSQLDRIEAAELNVQVEKEDYVLTGKIDLLMRGRNGLEVMDFKTGKRPTKNSQHLALYKQQLYLYALAIEKSKQQLPEKLFLYWTGEQRKEDALMEIPCQSEHVKQANRYFDDIAARIKRQEFAVVKPPGAEVCRVCDIRHLCKKQGVI